VDGANRHDVRLLSITLDGLVISRPEPNPEQPQHLCLVTAYDSTPVYQELLPECTPTAHFLCVYNERVDAIYADDELMPVSTTICPSDDPHGLKALGFPGHSP